MDLERVQGAVGRKSLIWNTRKNHKQRPPLKGITSFLTTWAPGGANIVLTQQTNELSRGGMVKLYMWAVTVCWTEVLQPYSPWIHPYTNTYTSAAIEINWGGSSTSKQEDIITTICMTQTTHPCVKCFCLGPYKNHVCHIGFVSFWEKKLPETFFQNVIGKNLVFVPQGNIVVSKRLPKMPKNQKP